MADISDVKPINYFYVAFALKIIISCLLVNVVRTSGWKVFPICLYYCHNKSTRQHWTNGPKQELNCSIRRVQKIHLLYGVGLRVFGYTGKGIHFDDKDLIELNGENLGVRC